MKTILTLLAAALLAGCDTRPQPTTTTTPPAVQAYHQANPEMQVLFAEWEGKGAFLFECAERRVYVAPEFWASWDAKRKEFMVRAMVLECVRRRADQNATLDVIDKQSGRVLATHSVSGVEIK